MTYAKRKAARPATAATAMEPWTPEAELALMNGDGDAGLEAFLYGSDPVERGALAVVGVTRTVW